MSPPASSRFLFLFLFVLLTVPVTHTFPLILDSASALTITNLTIPFGPNTISLNRTASSSLVQPIIHPIPYTYPTLILHIEPVPYPTRLDPHRNPRVLRGAIYNLQHLMSVHHLTRSSSYPGRFEYGVPNAFTLQACEMGGRYAPNPWQVGNLLDVMAGMLDVAEQIKWESGITVYRGLGGGAFEEVAAGAIYLDRPRMDGGAVAALRGVGGGRCAAGGGDEGASVGGKAAQLTG